MKTLVTSLLILATVAAGLSHANAPFPSKEQVGMLLNSKTYVVLEKSQLSYNIYLKKAVEEHWKLTEYEFIKRHDPKNSFLFLSKAGFENDNDDVYYDYLNLTLGDTAENISDMPEFAAIPVSYADDYTLDFGFAIEPMVLFVQDHVRNIQDKYLMLSMSTLKYYNLNTRKINNNKLLIDTTDIAPELRDRDVFREQYRGVFEFMPTEKIEKAIEGNDPDVLFLHVVKPLYEADKGRIFKMVFGADGQLYYYNYHYLDDETFPGFLPGDVKRID